MKLRLHSIHSPHIVTAQRGKTTGKAKDCPKTSGSFSSGEGEPGVAFPVVKESDLRQQGAYAHVSEKPGYQFHRSWGKGKRDRPIKSQPL